jgi:hypothetical protein
MSMVLAPVLAAAMAAHIPAGPAPATKMSGVAMTGVFRSFSIMNSIFFFVIILLKAGLQQFVTSLLEDY